MAKLEREKPTTLSRKPSEPVKKAAREVKGMKASPVLGVDKAAERRYMAEDALRTMQRAKEHAKNSSLMKDVEKLAKEKISNLHDLITDDHDADDKRKLKV